MKITSFDFWQKFGKALLVVVAVMPAAGLMISIGKLIGMSAGDVNAVHTIARVMEDIGWAIITNLHILFAVAIGGSWAKDRAGGAFAALLAFVLTNIWSKRSNVSGFKSDSFFSNSRRFTCKRLLYFCTWCTSIKHGSFRGDYHRFLRS
ncbi:hypothetical protein BK710_18610 [Bacillus thuringiensis serovar sumiyoshiensis]|nr:hypothetical protein BK710_18610 [Bacillus thuringiensis serovar sumiyoshiensis]